MSALGQKQTFAVQQPMSALPPIATAKADIRWWIGENSPRRAFRSGVRRYKTSSRPTKQRERLLLKSMGKRQSARLRVLIRRCRIKAAFNTSSDKGLELRVTHALHVDCGGGFELLKRGNRVCCSACWLAGLSAWWLKFELSPQIIKVRQ